MLELISIDDFERVTDARIEDVWNTYKASLQTSCEGAADALMAALASICSRRPEMLEKLLPDALEPLMMLGIEKATDVTAWAIHFTEQEVLYMGKPDEQAIAWINNEFIVSVDLIQGALGKFFDMD